MTALDESIAKLGEMIDARTAEFVRLRMAYDDLRCSAKIAVCFMDKAQTWEEMQLAVCTLKDAIAAAEKEPS